MTAHPWIVAGAVLTAAALISGFMPQPLLAQISGRPINWRKGLGLTTIAMVPGVLVVVGLTPSTGLDVAGALAVAAIVLTALLLVDGSALVIPDVYVILLLALALVGPLASQPGALIAGAAVGGGLPWTVRAFFRWFRKIEAMGLGDVKLMLALGALTGPERVLWIIVAGAVIGAAYSLLKGRGQPAPFGACAAAPALAVLIATKLGS